MSVLSIGDISKLVTGLFNLGQSIYNTVQNVKRNKQQCIVLGDYCQKVVATIREVAPADLTNIPEIQAALANVQEALQGALDDVQIIGEYSFAASIISQDKIKQIILDRRVALLDSFHVFGLVSFLSLHDWNAKFDQAAKDDHAEVLAAIGHVEDQVKEVALTLDKHTRRFDELQQALAPPPPSTVESPLHPNSVVDAMRILQLKLRSVSSETDPALHSSILASLRELSTSSQQMLPLADLDGEFARSGSLPEKTSTTAQVWKGVWLGGGVLGQRVALKCLHAATPSPGAVRRFHRQVLLLRKVRHPNLIQFYGVSYVDGPGICLVFPWMQYGDIMAYLKTHPHADRMKLMLGVACGIAHLHQQTPPIVHGNLQPSNVLINEKHEAVVSDFALAKELTLLGESGGLAVTLSSGTQASMRWLAPELSEDHYATPADVYSWSMTALQVISNIMPFPKHKSHTNVLIMVSRGERPVREDYPESFTDAEWELFQRCWTHDSNKRPLMAEVVADIKQMRRDLA